MNSRPVHSIEVTDETDLRDHGAPDCPVRNLVIAIVREAYDNYTAPRRAGLQRPYPEHVRKLQDGARDWFADDREHYEHPFVGFTFVQCCLILGFDPDWFRKRMRIGTVRVRAPQARRPERLQPHASTERTVA